MLRCLRLCHGGFGINQDLFELCRPLVLEGFIKVVQLTQQVRPAQAVHHVVKAEVRFPVVMYGNPVEGRQDTGQLSLPAIFRQFSHDGGQRRHALERSVLQLGWDQHQIRGPNCSFLDRTP